jgi:hypothetical protein
MILNFINENDDEENKFIMDIGLSSFTDRDRLCSTAASCYS